jgi:hypothetical protein
VASNPYLVIRRIMDKGKLWGVKVLWSGKPYKMTADRLREVIQLGKRTITVDLPGKAGDSPVALAIYNNSFRTLRDGHLCNNFNKVPSIKLISANKFRVLK